MRDPANFEFLQDLEVRYRQASHNEHERKLRMVTNPEHLESWIMPVAGSFTREAVELFIDEMVSLGQLDRAIPADDVMRFDLANQAYSEVASRPELQAAAKKAQAAAAKHGC